MKRVNYSSTAGTKPNMKVKSKNTSNSKNINQYYIWIGIVLVIAYVVNIFITKNINVNQIIKILKNFAKINPNIPKIDLSADIYHIQFMQFIKVI